MNTQYTTKHHETKTRFSVMRDGKYVGMMVIRTVVQGSYSGSWKFWAHEKKPDFFDETETPTLHFTDYLSLGRCQSETELIEKLKTHCLLYIGENEDVLPFYPPKERNER